MKNILLLSKTTIFLSFLFFNGLTYAQEPTTASSNLSFNNIDGNQFRIFFTPGNGSKRLIIAKEGSPVTTSPTDGIDYVAGPFGSGNELVPGSGEFVVYEGNFTSSVLISGLDNGKTYFLKIFDFNGSNTSTDYLTSSFLEGSQSTLTNPTIQASNISFSNVLGSSMTVSWTNGNGSGRLLIARANNPVNVEPQQLVEYADNINFGQSFTLIGTDNYVIYDGALNSVTIKNLEPGTEYHFAVFEYNGTNGKVYLTSTSTPSIAGAANSQITATTPTENTTIMGFSGIDGDRMRFSIPFSAYGNGTRRMIIAKQGSAVTSIPDDGQTYTANENFGLGAELNTGEFVVYNGSSGNNFPVNNLLPNTTYFFKVFEYNGTGTNTFYLTGSDSNSNPVFETSQATLAPPTTQASNITFSNIEGNSMTVSWTNGDGTGRILIAKEGSSVDAVPQQLIDYSNSTSFGAGFSEIGTANYVIFDGFGSSTIINNLQPGITYHFAVFEYTGSTAKQYLTSPVATNSQITNAFPTENTTFMGFSGVDGDRMRLSFPSSGYGNGANRIIIAKQGGPVTATPVNGQSYTADNAFGNGTEIAPDEFVVYNGSFGNSTLITNLQPQTTYHFKVFEYNSSGSNTFYLTGSDDNNNPVFETSQATLSPPAIPASNITFSNVLGTSMTVNWTNGDGDGRILIGKAGGTVDAVPQQLVDYNAAFNGMGNNTFEIGTDNYVLYESVGSGINVINLLPNVTYHFAVFEYTGSSGKQYLTSPLVTNSQSTLSTPTENTTNMGFSTIDGDRLRFSFSTNDYGNGSHRMIVAKQGSAVTAVPVDGQSYTANSVFGNGQEIAPGEFVVYNGTSGNGFQTTNLQPSTTYHFKVFEYYINGSDTYYLTGNDINNNPVFETSQATLSPPTTNSAAAFFNSKTSTSFTLNWTNGDGSSRLLLMKEGEPVDVEPIDFTSYAANPASFGNSTFEVGTGNYAVYSSSGNSVNVTNLSPGTNYYFELFEYNGNTGRIYLRPGYVFQEQTFGSTPTVQVSNPIFSVITSTSFEVDFDRGNGSHRLVLAKKDNPVDANPTDLNSYVANNSFGLGDEIGTGNFVVYNDTGENFLLTNLDPLSTYHLAFYEYSISASGELYLTPALEASQATTTIPCSIPTNTGIANITATTAAFSWDAQASATGGYEYFLTSDSTVPDGTTTPTGTVGAGSTNVSLTGLQPSTTYSAYVRSNCGSGISSDWSSPSSFTTTGCPIDTYSGNGNTGFGDVVGNSTLSFEDDGTTITGTFTKGPGNFNDAMVIYLSTGQNGRSEINIDVNDQADDLRRAISQAGTDGSVVTFPTGFQATHAIAIDVGFGGLWSIPATGTVGNNGLNFIDAVGNPSTVSQSGFTFSFDWAELGLSSKDEFDFVITYLNSTNGFSSNEGYGDGLPSSNPGTADFTFTSSKSYPQYTYTFDGTSWSPNSPDGINNVCERAFIQSGTAILSNATSLHTIKVNPEAVLDPDADLTADLIFKSSASGSGQLADVTGLTITGEALVERYINPRRAFRFLASAVSTGSNIRDNWQEGGNFYTNFGTHITGTGGNTNGFDDTQTDNPSMFTFDNTFTGNQDLAWNAMSNTNSNTLENRQPYLLFVRGDRSVDLNNNFATPTPTILRAKGSLHIGNDNTQTLSQVNDYFNLVANPYQAKIDFDNLTANNLRQDIIVFNPQAGTFGLYETITSNKIILPGQSFFVQNDGDVTTPSGGATIEFDENDKATTGSSSTTVFSNDEIMALDLELYNQDNLRMDVMKFFFYEDGNNNIDDYDTGKLFNTTENLFTVIDGNALSVERRNIPQNNEVIPVNLLQHQSSNYKFKAAVDQWDNSIEIFVLDNYMNTQTQLTANQDYNFTVDPSIPESIAADRFSVILNNTTLSLIENTFNQTITLYPNPVEDGVFNIKTKDLSGTVSIDIVNILGQKLLSGSYSFQNDEISIDVSGFSSGVYIVKLSQGNQYFISKLIVE